MEAGESVATSGVGGVSLTSGVDELTTAGPVGDSRGGGCADGDGTVDVTRSDGMQHKDIPTVVNGSVGPELANPAVLVVPPLSNRS